jgi:hypothetical protein
MSGGERHPGIRQETLLGWRRLIHRDERGWFAAVAFWL